MTLPYSVATLHTLFNIINTAILIWFIPQIERAVTLMVPAPKGEKKEIYRLKYIPSQFSTAEIALTEASHAIINFGRICNKDFGYIRRAINYAYDDTQKDALCEKLVKYEKITDNIEFEIAAYLTDVSKANISAESKDRIKCMYKIIGEMESLGDSGEAISRMIQRTADHGKKFGADMLAKLNNMLDLVQDALDAMMDNLTVPFGELKSIKNSETAEAKINELRNNLREEHIVNIEKASYNYQTGVFYMDLVNELEKMGDFIINISQAALASNETV